MKGQKALFSSASEEWATPQDFYDKLDSEFHFTLDPCSTHENHKCKTYFTKEQDGLKKSWGGYRVFCNPPYGKQLKLWVQKSNQESTKKDTLVVLLIPARTDTAYFHDWIYNQAELRFIRGRLKFGNSKNSAPFPSMLAIFNSNKSKGEIKNETF